MITFTNYFVQVNFPGNTIASVNADSIDGDLNDAALAGDVNDAALAGDDESINSPQKPQNKTKKRSTTFSGKYYHVETK